MFRTITTQSNRLIRKSLKNTYGIQSFQPTTTTMMATRTTQQCQLRLFSSEEDSSSSKQVGHVKWFDVKKGFGFIIPSDGSGDVFIHQTNIKAEGFRSLAEGEEVEFEVTEEDNGRRTAFKVTGPNGSNVKGAPRRQPQQFSSDYSSNSGNFY